MIMELFFMLHFYIWLAKILAFPCEEFLQNLNFTVLLFYTCLMDLIYDNKHD